METILNKVSIKYGFKDYEHLKQLVKDGVNSFDLLEDIIIEAFNKFRL